MNRVLVLLVVVVLAGGVAISRGGAFAAVATHRLTPVLASGVEVDTLLIGGYAQGRFVDAVSTLSSDLSDAEAELLGGHLDRLYESRFGAEGLTRPGRLRIAYERMRRPGGETRAIRVLGAEVASGGRLHTLLQYDAAAEGDGYYDPEGLPLDGGAWRSPLASLRVSSPFGRTRMHPILGRVLPHTGVDLAASRGSEVRAPADGIVAAAGERGGYGLLVELQHPNGYGTRYAHLDRLADGLRRSSVVRAGDLLGYVGSSGLATGPHLHYEVRRRGQPIDPLARASQTAIGGNLMSSPEWRVQRRAVMELLGQSPTVIRGD